MPSESLQLPPSFQSVPYAGDVLGRAEHFEPIQVRHVALAADDLSGEAVRLAEVRVSCGDDSADPLPVVLVVEEPDDLLGDRSPLLAAPLASPVGGGHQD